MKKITVLLSSLYIYSLLVATDVLAQDGDIQQAIGDVPAESAPFTSLGKLIGSLLQIVYYAAGLFFFINLLYGGLQWIMSGGDKAGLDAARGRITNSFIGLIIVVAAVAITYIIERVLGIKILSGFEFKGPERG